MKDVMVYVDQQTQGLREIKDTQRHVQLVMTSIDRCTGSRKDDTSIMGTKKDLHKERDHRIQVEAQGTKTLVESTRHVLEAKIAEVRDNFLQGLETTGREFKMQLADVEARGPRDFGEYSITDARAERRSCQRTGTGAGVAQTPELDGSSSWPAFRRQVEAVEEHNGQTPGDKAEYLIAGLNKPAAHILHSVPTGATYEEVRRCSSIVTATTTWRKYSMLS
jgi:hypothetical protein